MESKRVIILEQTGHVNKIFAILPDLLNDVDNKTTKEEYSTRCIKNKEAILECLRRDNEHNVSGPGVPETNPSKNSIGVDFRYNPVFYRQRIATSLPYKLTATITVIDAFACMGSRFGLQQLQVFVEVYQSNCGSNRIWAHIFYVADSEIPVCTIEASYYRY